MTEPKSVVLPITPLVNPQRGCKDSERRGKKQTDYFKENVLAKHSILERDKRKIYFVVFSFEYGYIANEVMR